MEKLRVLVADDEPLARERLTRLLREAQCEILAELADGPALVAWMAASPDSAVDVLFLDIQMPGLNGLEALAELKNPPLTVFVTAYKDYALQAFDAAALDYLQKPVYEERLAKTLQRVRERQIRRLTPSEWKAMIPPLERVTIKAGAGLVFMDLKVITHFELADERVWAFTPTERLQTRWTALREVEQAFPEAGMVRIQRNLLVRPEAVVGCKAIDGGRLEIRLPKGLELIVSRAMVQEFKGRLGPH
jgi:two-component system LytT family response regulator/two-component system response regulator AlgR